MQEKSKTNIYGMATYARIRDVEALTLGFPMGN